MLKKITLFSLVLVSFWVKAQVDSIMSSTKYQWIDSVDIIYDLNQTYSNEDFKIDLSNVAGNNEMSSLQDALCEGSNVGVKVYGAEGALSTLSIGGMSSSHTQVMWNGFNINSSTLGSFDLGQFQQNGFDQISLDLAASGTANGSGAIAGVLNIQSKPVFKKEKKLSIGIENGKYDYRQLDFDAPFAFNKKVFISSAINTEKSSTQIAFQYVNAPNNYAVINEQKYGSPVERVSYNKALLYGGNLTHYQFIGNKFLLGMGLNYNLRDKEIPSISNFQDQYDENLRAFISGEFSIEKVNVNLSSAIINDQLYYYSVRKSDLDTLVNSDIHVLSFRNRLNLDRKFGKYLRVDFQATYDHYFPEVYTYSNISEEFNHQVFIGLNYTKNQFSILPSYRVFKYFGYKDKTIGGIHFKKEGDKFKYTLGLDQKFRIPTFNDRFWTPGGDPHLAPEEGIGANGAITYYWKKSAGNSVKILYQYNFISNWIQWIAGEGYWYPTSYMKVENQAIGWITDFKLKGKRLSTIHQIAFNYTNTKIVAVKGESNYTPVKMPYVPSFAANYNLTFLMNRVRMIYKIDYESSKFTDNSNNEVFQLEAFLLMHFQIETSFKIKDLGQFDVYMKVNNLANTNYQMVRNFYMPGRYIKLGTILKLNK